MGQVLHGSATTTVAVRRAIQPSTTLARLKQSGVNMSRTLGCKSLITCERALGDEKV